MKAARPHSLRQPSMAEAIVYDVRSDIEDIRTHAQALAAGQKATTLELLQWAVVAERARIDGENLSKSPGSPGRPPSEDWRRRLGMDPVDALVFRQLLGALECSPRPAQLVRDIAKRAIANDPGALEDDLSKRLATQPVEQWLRRFFKEPHTEFQTACDARMATLQSLEEQQVELRRIANIIDPTWFEGAV